MWITRWDWRCNFDWHWWTLGLVFIPGWGVTFCLGPLGLTLGKSKIHI